MELIAEAAAGDVRVGLEILRVAARRASQQNLDEITDDVIYDAIPKAESEIRQRNVESLTDDQRVLYDIITEHDEVQPDELYESYRNRADDPKTDRMVRNYLRKMERYNLIRIEGQNRGRTYHSIS